MSLSSHWSQLLTTYALTFIQIIKQDVIKYLMFTNESMMKLTMYNCVERNHENLRSYVIGILT